MFEKIVIPFDPLVKETLFEKIEKEVTKFEESKKEDAKNSSITLTINIDQGTPKPLRQFALVTIVHSLDELKKTYPLFFKKITRLDLSKNQLCSKDIDCLYQNLFQDQSFSMLSSDIFLDLSENKIGLSGFSRLVQMITNDHIKLKELNLNHNLICSGKKVPLSKQISDLKILQTKLISKILEVSLEGNNDIPPEISNSFSTKKQQKAYFFSNQKKMVANLVIPENLIKTPDIKNSNENKRKENFFSQPERFVKGEISSSARITPKVNQANKKTNYFMDITFSRFHP